MFFIAKMAQNPLFPILISIWQMWQQTLNAATVFLSPTYFHVVFLKVVLGPILFIMCTPPH